MKHRYTVQRFEATWRIFDRKIHHYIDGAFVTRMEARQVALLLEGAIRPQQSDLPFGSSFAA